MSGQMTHHRTFLISTARAPLNVPPQSSHVDTSEDEYYKSNASSCSSERSFAPSDSDVEQVSEVLECVDVKSMIATVPEAQLRAAIAKVAANSHTFRHAVARELSASNGDRGLVPPRKSRRWRRNRHSVLSTPTTTSSSTCINCGGQFRDTPGLSSDECLYHPGELEADVYEFISKTPEGQELKVLKNITMWSCCEEDLGSPGCTVAPRHVNTFDQAGLPNESSG